MVWTPSWKSGSPGGPLWIDNGSGVLEPAWSEDPCACCGGVLCGNCGGMVPEFIPVQVAGIANSPECTGCTDLNGIYLFPFIGNSGSFGCAWGQSVPPGGINDNVVCFGTSFPVGSVNFNYNFDNRGGLGTLIASFFGPSPFSASIARTGDSAGHHYEPIDDLCEPQNFAHTNDGTPTPSLCDDSNASVQTLI